MQNPLVQVPEQQPVLAPLGAQGAPSPRQTHFWLMQVPEQQSCGLAQVALDPRHAQTCWALQLAVTQSPPESHGWPAWAVTAHLPVTQLPVQQSESWVQSWPPAMQLQMCAPRQVPLQQSLLPAQEAPPVAHAHWPLPSQEPEQQSDAAAQEAPGVPHAQKPFWQLPLQQAAGDLGQATPTAVQVDMSGSTIMSGPAMSGTSWSACMSAGGASTAGPSFTAASTLDASSVDMSAAGRSPVPGSIEAGRPSFVGARPLVSKPQPGTSTRRVVSVA
jgi:hypothetical protein